MNKGIYLLFIFLNKDKRIKIGKLGRFLFPKGNYCYVGSALNNLEKRILRHKSKHKKLHWHIDYFLKYGKIIKVRKIKTSKKIECKIAQRVAKKGKVIVNGFGSSDCSCKSHLFYLNTKIIK